MPGIAFASSSGNRYYYDDLTGVIFPQPEGQTTQTGYEPYLQINPRPDSNPANFQPNAAQVKQHLLDQANGFRQMILQITGSCNLRCKYCIYSDHYPLTNSYEDQTMDTATARRAVDFYLENFAKVAQRNPSVGPTIGFYGGEPLLNLTLIREVVSYIQEKYLEQFPNLLYTITTNGLLLSGATARFLVEHNFSVIVSLDGGRANHDRNRVKPDGTGSFDQVYRNLAEFRSEYPDYEKIAAVACYDLQTNFFDLHRFFNELNIMVVAINPVDSHDTSFYNQFTQADYDKFNKHLEEFRQSYLEQLRQNKLEKHSFIQSYLGLTMATFAFRPMLRETRPVFHPYTSCCVPGEKIYVTTDGTIHMCERINPHFAIGNVHQGLDYERIAALIAQYQQAVLSDCQDCPVSRFCSACFSNIGGPGRFLKRDNYCAETAAAIQKSLVEYVDLLEARPDILDDITTGYYRDLLAKVGYFLE